MGHSDFSITAKTYAHVDYKNKASMANSLDEQITSREEAGQTIHREKEYGAYCTSNDKGRLTDSPSY